MQLSNIPGKLVLPFANAGGKSTIPVASQIGITAGAASLTDGFPPLTRTPIAAGGVPPSGLDMNGILYEMSAIIRWANAGGGYPFDGTFATDTNVGGYPKGARIMRSDGQGYWFNTTDNNVTDPNDAGAVAAGWVPDFTTGIAAVTMTSANVTLTPLQYGKPVIVITGTLTSNLNLIFPAIEGQWAVINNTTGAFAITAKTASGTGILVSGVQNVVGDATNIYSLGANSDAIAYTPPGTGAITTTVKADISKKIWADRFIPLGTNVGSTDCSTYIQKALDLANSLGNASVEFPPFASAVKCDSGLTFYPNTTTVNGNGTTLDFSGMTSGYSVAFSQSNPDANGRNAVNRAHPIAGLYFNGATGAYPVTAVKAIDQNPLSGPSYWLSGVTFRDCAFMNFYRDVEFGNGSFLFAFINCVFSITGGSGYDTSLLMQSASNSGENFEFINCFWGNKGTMIRCLNGNASVYFRGCSADYLVNIFDVQEGAVDWDGYIESNTDVDYWGKVLSVNSHLRIAGMISVTGNKSQYELFYSGAAATNGGLVVDVNLQIGGGVTYAPPSRNLVAGTGRVVWNMRTQGKDTAHPAIGGGCNVLANGGFESAALTDWILGGVTPPARSTTVARTGTYSLAFAATVVNTPVASRIIPCQQGQFFVGGYWYQVSGINGTGATFYANIDYLDAGGTSLAGSAVMVATTDVGSWTHVGVSTLTPAPIGSVNAKITINIFGTASGTPIGYVDDVTLAVI